MELFDSMAARYDTEERDRVAGVIAGAIRKAVGDAAGKSAIDYGCGTGLVGLKLAGCFKSLLMVDSAPKMIEQVRGKLERAGITGVDTLCANFAAAPPEGLSADVVFMAQVLLHIPDTAAILRRLHGLINPGGTLLIVDFNKDDTIPADRVHNGFDQAELAGLVRRAGFSTASADTFYYGRNLFMGKDASLFLLQAGR